MHPRATARLLSLSRHFSRSAPAFNNTGPNPNNPRLSRVMSFSESKDEVAPGSKVEDKPAVVSEFSFPLSAVPKNPLGEGKWIKTAAALIIGDEILNGKTLDRNSNYFARYCFEYGIELKRIEVIADDEDEIIEASRRMVNTYDFVITSGGIGPTHDDITYASLARSFGQSLVHHQETLHRMQEMSKQRWGTSLAQQNPEQRAARERMALFPDKAEVLFIAPDVWVPVVRLEGKLCVFPGIPKLFQRMLTGLTPFLPLPPPSERPCRQQIFTSQPESSIAPFLTDLQARTKSQGIRVGSYPLLARGVYVSLIGRDPAAVQGFAQEVVAKLEGKLVTEEEAREMVREKEKGAA